MNGMENRTHKARRPTVCTWGTLMGAWRYGSMNAWNYGVWEWDPLAHPASRERVVVGTLDFSFPEKYIPSQTGQFLCRLDMESGRG